RRKNREYRRVRAQREFCHHESRRRRNAHKIDKDCLIVERVQVGQKPEGSLTGAQQLQHRARSRELIDRLISKPRTDAIDHLLDLRVVDSSDKEGEWMTEE